MCIPVLEYRSTPISSIGLYPAQILFNCRLRTKLSISNKLLNPEIFQNIGNSLKQQQSKKFCYDKTAKALRPLKLEENVYVQKFRNETCEPAKVLAKGKNSRSYKVKTLTNKVYIRNRKHLTSSKGN